ncbi:hypothetical protein QRD40_10770 [Comamonas sp. Y6]|uniref:Uncharacterized protein n=1 Tax=Comamonas resistens TaxID=3046670 RepID=A0ABY8SVT5_9BURK|nr:hypothetical protein [Comamonas resistens]MDL5036829.1 hypothetical protein [Comamonas resistens]WHS67139.1 hypothetical protein QMY55_08485 [Comamonas resistens]
MKEIKAHQFYRLPSGSVIKVNSPLSGGEWNCTYQSGEDIGCQVTLSAEFLLRHGERT